MTLCGHGLYHAKACRRKSVIPVFVLFFGLLSQLLYLGLSLSTMEAPHATCHVLMATV